MLETIEARNIQIEKMSETERKARRKRLGKKEYQIHDTYGIFGIFPLFPTFSEGRQFISLDKKCVYKWKALAKQVYKEYEIAYEESDKVYDSTSSDIKKNKQVKKTLDFTSEDLCDIFSLLNEDEILKLKPNKPNEKKQWRPGSSFSTNGIELHMRFVSTDYPQTKTGKNSKLKKNFRTSTKDYDPPYLHKCPPTQEIVDYEKMYVLIILVTPIPSLEDM